MLFANGTEKFYFGESILDAIILAGNREVFTQLPEILALKGQKVGRLFEINSWTTELARASQQDPFFAPLAREFPVRMGGQKFEPELLNYGRLDSSQISELKKIAQSKDLQALFKVLSQLLPYGSVGVYPVPASKTSQAELFWEQTSLFPEDPNRVREVQIQILERSAEWAPWKGLQFILRSRVDSSAYFAGFERGRKPSDSPGYFDLKGDRVNWIRSMNVTDQLVTILVERDAAGARYGSGKFHELELRLNSSGRVEFLTIRNGNSLLLRRLWAAKSVRIPEKAQSYGMFHIPGEIDLSRNRF